MVQQLESKEWFYLYWLGRLINMKPQTPKRPETPETSDTIKVNNAILIVTQVPYNLSEADFLRLKTNQPLTISMVLSLFGIISAFAVSDIIPSLIGKYFLNNNATTIDKSKLITIVVLLLITIIIYAIGYFKPNERKKILSKIDKHFECNKPKQEYTDKSKRDN